MVSKTWKAMLVTAVASYMTMMATAQAPQGGLPIGSGSALAGMTPSQYRMYTLSRLGLHDSALKLTTTQKAEISKLVDAYAIEQTKLDQRYPTALGTRPNEVALAARQSALTTLTAAVSLVMNNDQRRVWGNAQAARRSALERADHSPPSKAAK